MPHPDHKALPLGRSFWAIQPDALPRLMGAMRNQRRLQQLQPAPEATQPALAAARHANGGAGVVAVIPLTGLISARGSWLDVLFGGGGGLMAFRDSFRDAINSPDVQAIVLDVDSPGGYVDLVPETAQEIYDARGSKPIIAVANTMAASAGYFIASQADEVVVTPSGSVGSIGVYMLHEDWSGWNEQAGIAPTYIYAGRHKVEGNMDEPLSEDAREDWQQEVDDLYAMFIDAVAQGRGVTADVVRADYGEGRTLLADRALAAGLVNRIATLETVIGEQLAPGRTGAAAAHAGRLASIRPMVTAEPADQPPTPPDPLAETVDDDEAAPDVVVGDPPTETDDERDPAEINADTRTAWVDVQALPKSATPA